MEDTVSVINRMKRLRYKVIVYSAKNYLTFYLSEMKFVLVLPKILVLGSFAS